jgi:hypothetical protein
MRPVSVGVLAGVAAVFASHTQGGVLPSSWSVTTGVNTEAFTSIVNDSDVAVSFFGITESMVFNEAYQYFEDPPEKILAAIARGDARLGVQSITDGWFVDSRVFARVGSEVANADASAFNAFEATFFVEAGTGFLVNGELTDYGNKSSDFAGYDYGVRMEIFRNDVLVFESDGWEDDFAGPQDIYSRFENAPTGAEFRLLITSNADADSYPGPGGWNSEAYMEYEVSVTSYVPAPGVGLPILGLAFLARRRR